MKITKITPHNTATPETVLDLFTDQGYVQGNAGGLPDVDSDFEALRLQDVRKYTESRYNAEGKTRVFMAGTFTTMKIKAAIKDVARVHKVAPSIANYITAIIDEAPDKPLTYSDFIKQAAATPKLAKFINEYPKVFEDLRTLMFQPRSSSIHASAQLITPSQKDGEEMECFDYTPIKKIDGQLVSEFSGYELDECGLLKNDSLSTKELSKLHQVIDICNREYNAGLSLELLARGECDDEKAFDLLCQGYTQNIFQLSSKGMTKFITSMKPKTINDVIAANALFRPATLDSGSSEGYIDRKNGEVAPTYLWGTHETMKDTYGVLCYQEQLMQIALNVGGFSLGDGYKLIKFISKKKHKEIQAMHDKFMSGASSKGCPKEDAKAIWALFENAGSYLFNKCISGNEKIYRNRTGRWEPTIAEMYKLMHDKAWSYSHGHKAAYGKYHSPTHGGYGTGWSMMSSQGQNFLRKNQIVDIRYMGVRRLFRITLENGATIDVTENHKHPTTKGIKRTDELLVGVDEMYCNIGSMKEDTTYRFTDKNGAWNDRRYHARGKEERYVLNSKKGHLGFFSRDTNYTKLMHYNKNLKKDFCEKCGAQSCRLETHHINNDHSDSGEDYSNLITLCSSCHKKEHYKLGRAKHGEKGLDVRSFKVISVESVGDGEVYDVEMAHPHHTFTTGNGVVTCNSHATAYAVTAYAGAYLKAHYPTPFYTVALQWANDDELVAVMGEMEACSNAKVVAPDINVSDIDFKADYQTNEIFWSLSRVKMLGAKVVDWIIREREKNGAFTGIDNFIDRIFKYKFKHYQYWDDPDNEDEVERCPVNARHIRNLILAGCFDKSENALSVVERFAIIEKAAKKLGFEITEKEFPLDLRGKHYFWSQQQIAISGLGSVDYRRIYDNSATKPFAKRYAKYFTLKDCLVPENEDEKVAVCATVAEVNEKKFESKKTGKTETFCTVILHQNNDIVEMVAWPEDYARLRGDIMKAKGRLIVVTGFLKYSSFANKNNLVTNKKTQIEIV